MMCHLLDIFSVLLVSFNIAAESTSVYCNKLHSASMSQVTFNTFFLKHHCKDRDSMKKDCSVVLKAYTP